MYPLLINSGILSSLSSVLECFTRVYLTTQIQTNTKNVALAFDFRLQSNHLKYPLKHILSDCPEERLETILRPYYSMLIICWIQGIE